MPKESCQKKVRACCTLGEDCCIMVERKQRSTKDRPCNLHKSCSPDTDPHWMNLMTVETSMLHQMKHINPFCCLSHSLNIFNIIILHQPLKLKFQNWFFFCFCFCILLNNYDRHIQLSHEQHKHTHEQCHSVILIYGLNTHDERGMLKICWGWKWEW